MKNVIEMIIKVVLLIVAISLLVNLVNAVLPLAIVAGIVYLVYRFREEIKNFLGIGKAEVIKEKQF